MVHRARARIRAEGPRVRVGPDARARLLDRFLRALHADDEAALLALFAPEAKLVSDSGGKVTAARKTLVGPRRIVGFLLGLQRRWGRITTHRVDSINGDLALVTEREGRLFATTSFETDGERVLALYRVLNPDKLRAFRPTRA
jgi:RNA polymerase sigma-70 factor (ECF subfamily)